MIKVAEHGAKVEGTLDWIQLYVCSRESKAAWDCRSWYRLSYHLLNRDVVEAFYGATKSVEEQDASSAKRVVFVLIYVAHNLNENLIVGSHVVKSSHWISVKVDS